MIDWSALLATIAPTPLQGIAHRLVESQEQIATNALVSSLERQAVLEDMLERTKPPNRSGTQELHYLLATPFRYPPLRHGSRFGTRAEPSLFYGAPGTDTVLAEAAYYRFVFWHGMRVPPDGKIDTQHTLFGARFACTCGLRLQAPPFDAYRAHITDRSRYTSAQALGAAMRATGIEAFEFPSARDPGGGLNVALYTPTALASPKPVFQSPWLCELTADTVRFAAVGEHQTLSFTLDTFLDDGRLPMPACL